MRACMLSLSSLDLLLKLCFYSGTALDYCGNMHTAHGTLVQQMQCIIIVMTVI